jgi:hypothetical protein
MSWDEKRQGKNRSGSLFDEETLRRVRFTPEWEGKPGERRMSHIRRQKASGKGSFLAFCWPEITDIESAEKAAGQGVIAAAFCGLVTTIVAVLGEAGFQPIKGETFDAWLLVDAAIMAAVAVGIAKMSRSAAVLGWLIYLIGKLITWSHGSLAGSPISILMLLMFINGVRGTMAYRNFMELGSPGPADDARTEFMA